MNAIDAMATLRNMGYRIRLEGKDSIKLLWKGRGKPDKEQVLPLMDRLRANKGKVLHILWVEHVRELFEGEIIDKTLPHAYQRPKTKQGKLF